MHTCAVLADGTARCWGDNSDGQLGNGTTDQLDRPPSPSPASPAPPPSPPARITPARCSATAPPAAGATTATASSATAPHRPAQPPPSPSPASPAPPPSPPATISHPARVLADGTARCWGDNTLGQLGNGTTTNSSHPRRRHRPHRRHRHHRRLSPHLRAARRRHRPLLGRQQPRANSATAPPTNSSTPVAVTGITGAGAIDAGAAYSCARLGDGTARCWGNNSSGQLGDGTTINSSVPVAVTGLP